MELKDKICVITGGTSGIGEATVHRFVEEGAKVVFCGRRADRGQQVLDAVLAKNYPGEVRFFRCDVSSPEEVENLAKFTKEEFGNCEVLFTNAGIHRTGKIHEVTLEQWNSVMRVDLQGVFLCCHYFVPQMLEKQFGTIINMSSVSGLAGDYNMIAYNTAKGAITNLTRCLALDYADQGIRANAVCPGTIATEITDATFKADPAVYDKFVNAYPVHFIAGAVDVANLCVFLASRKADFINGANIPIDGGILAHTGQPYIPDGEE